MRMISRELSNKIANMGFACACLIVWTHTSVLTGGGGGMFKDGLTAIAVPVFFVISGFFLGLRIDEDGWYLRAVRKRVQTLVVPFFVLNIVWWPIKYGIHYVGVLYFGASDASGTMDITFYNFLSQTGFIPWGGNAVVGLWYLKALFLLVCAAPIFVWFVRRGRWMTLVLLTSLLSIWCIQRGTVWPPILQGKMTFELCARCPLYFTIGLFLSRCAEFQLRKGCRVMMAVPLMVFAVGAVSLKEPSSGYVQPLFWVLIVLAVAAGVWALIPSRRLPQVFVGNSFAIFVFHGCVLFLLEKGLRAAHCWDWVENGLGLFPVMVCVIVVAILAAEGLRRFAPRFAALVFGGR